MKSQRNGKLTTIPERIMGENYAMFQIAEQGSFWAIREVFSHPPK